MLTETRRALRIPLIRANAEDLPVADTSIDFISMGVIALRHVSDLGATFQEFLRVLRPGGVLLLLEISRPDSRTMQGLSSWYLGRFVPFACRWLMPRTSSAALMHYFWRTIEHCVPDRRHPGRAGHLRLRRCQLPHRSGRIPCLPCAQTRLVVCDQPPHWIRYPTQDGATCCCHHDLAGSGAAQAGSAASLRRYGRP